jgi:hypothetical protein
VIIDVNWVFDSDSLDYYRWRCLVVVIIGSHVGVELSVLSFEVLRCFRRCVHSLEWAVGSARLGVGRVLDFLASFGLTKTLPSEKWLN